MKKLILFGLLGFFILLIGTGMYVNLAGMASVRTEVPYHCSDTDSQSNNEYNVMGTVTITHGSEKNSYTDYCVDEETLGEYFCDPGNNKQLLMNYSCSEADRICRYGRCFLKEW